MMIGRAPLRISFGGGGTDLEAYYARYGGMVISASINKYVYGTVTKNFDSCFQVISADLQSVYNSANIAAETSELKLPRAVLDHFGLNGSFNLFTASEVPPGTGLGSSGTTAVNLVNIFSTLMDRPMTKEQVADTAFHIETVKLGAPVGKQDQYASAFGGINCFRFGPDGVTVEPLRLPASTIRRLERSMMLFFTGNSRQAWAILQQQRESTSREEGIVIESLHEIKCLAVKMRSALETGDLDGLGRLMDESWQQKKRLSAKISNEQIDQAYLAAKRAGALGGKITGAGGGGFLLFYCPPEGHQSVRLALEALGLREMRFAFEFQGARVLMNTTNMEPNIGWGEE
ncbi:MAG: GHMP kinase [Dehalococcoidia bacterium]|nr:GHMP kinase [Dehalococcoidia bacterium]